MENNWWGREIQKQRHEHVVPGTSQFIISETASNLRHTKDALAGVCSQLESSSTQLNQFIDELNDEASFHDLEAFIRGSYPEPEIEDPEHTSISIRSDYESSGYSTNHRLLLPYSERILEPSLPPDPVHEPLPVVDRKLDMSPLHRESSDIRKNVVPQNENVPSPKHSGLNVHQISQEQNIPIKMEFLSHDGHLHSDANQSLPSAALESSHHPAIPQKNNIESTKSVAPKENHYVDDSTAAVSARHQSTPIMPQVLKSEPKEVTFAHSSIFSPIKPAVPVAPLTSSDIELSFGINADLSNHRSDTNVQANKDFELDSDGQDQTDDSFQAISTAIRKSFAGKTSVAPNAIPSTVLGDVENGSETTGKPFSHRSEKVANSNQSQSGVNARDVRVKSEVDTSKVMSPTSPNNVRQKSFRRSRSMAPLFVSLPKRELINTLAASGRAFRQDDSLHSNKASTSLPNQQGIQEKTVSSKSFRQPPPVDESVSNNVPKISSVSIPDLFSGKSFNGTRLAPTKITLGPESSPRLSPDKSTTTENRATDKGSSRTTNDGSPVRRYNVAKPPHLSQRHPDSVKSSIKLPLSSSVNSSRSPTKYSHKADRTSWRGSPTDHSIHRAEEKKPRFKRSVSPARRSPTRSAKPEKKSMTDTDFFKNRFSATALLPGNERSSERRHNVPDPRVETVTAKKKTDRTNLSSTRATPGKTTVRSMPKVTLEFSSKQNLRLSHDSKLQPKPRAPSPVKKPQAKPETSSTSFTQGKRSSVQNSHQSIPRKRPNGNAIPLPEAARGKFRRDVTSRPQDGESIAASSAPLREPNKQGTSPSVALPDIPSDDDLFRETKYLKDWAETPKVIKAMKQMKHVDPETIYGECPDVDTDDIFRSVKVGNGLSSKP